MKAKKEGKSVAALKVRQWLTDWNEISWQPDENRAEPRHWFYQFSMSAAKLKSLSGIYARTTRGRTKASQDLGIQRGHDKDRSNEISDFVRYGYPWSNLSKSKRDSGEFHDLRQPGWLPTAIIVNILTENDERRGKKVAPDDLIEIVDDGNSVVKFLFPGRGSTWKPKGIPPIEVIDGQHRLWAFGDASLAGDYELPVVAFVGLDLSWQAYLFYTINIKPKKINASLAFDLYPLLRTEKWLTKFEGHIIYRETRAQELVDLLWSHPESPWRGRINMLGERGQKGRSVTQASWIRSLLASFVKSWEGSGISIGGLFGSSVGEHDTVLNWSRLEQAAFLIVVGQEIQKKISNRKDPWMEALRSQNIIFETGVGDHPLKNDDQAFSGPKNLINSDQGNRVLLQSVNDLCFVKVDDLRLDEWGGEPHDSASEEEEVALSVKSLRKEKSIYGYLKQLSSALATYDWRSSDGPKLTEDERLHKAAFRGSGGYKELRRDVLLHLSSTGGEVGHAADDVMTRLGY